MSEEYFSKKDKRVAAYTIDLRPGYHRYVKIEGIGECREHFMKLVHEIDQGNLDVVLVASAQLLFVDISPMWMEKFLATVKEHFVLIADAVIRNNNPISMPIGQLSTNMLFLPQRMPLLRKMRLS